MMAKLKVVHKWVGTREGLGTGSGPVELGHFTCKWVGLGRVKKIGPTFNSGQLCRPILIDYVLEVKLVQSN